jgi:serine/threonine-protein kinase
MIASDTVVGGRYRVLRPLGGGGMKLVYLAEDLRLAARPCALAEMVDSITNPDMQRQAVAAFQREADMLAQLSNEHIPRIYDRFSEQNRHYLVMEFIDGITLEDMIRKSGGKLDERRVIDVALQVLDTLDYLHNLSPPVIYRDLKPSNVMLTPSGLVKLIDFGIARLFRPQSNATMIGTQGYAPPEQYKGKVDARSDLYALGATVHHALSGRDPALEPPFSFPRLRSLRPDVTPALAELIDQSLRYDVADRVASAAEFRRRLVAIRDGRLAPAHSSGARDQLGLPLGGAARPSMAPSSPTLLTNVADIDCPQCYARIPADSRYCSFCGADVAGASGVAAADLDAQTILLGSPAAGSESGRTPAARPAQRRRASGRGAGFYALLFGGMFIGAFLLATYLLDSGAGKRGYSEPDATAMPAPYGEISPDAPDPPHRTTREWTLRRVLDDAGYTQVRFRVDRNSITLWGRVPSEFDRARVQMLVFHAAGIYIIDDKLIVDPRLAGR